MSWIRQRLENFGDQIACHEAGRQWSYRDFLSSIDQIRQTLVAIEEPQAVVAIQTERSIEGLAAIIAISELGLVALPLPLELPDAEQAKQIEIAGVSHTLRSTSGSDALGSTTARKRHPLVEQLPSSGLILFSSGTSGEPKAMLHNLDALLNRYESVRPRSDRSLQLLLNDHIGGLDSAFRSLFAGSTILVPEARTPEATGRTIAQHKANILPASPTFLNLMLMANIPAKYDCSSIEIIAYGAEPMPEPLLKRLSKAFPCAELQQKFGTSETGTVRIKSTAKESLFFRIQDADTEWKSVEGELWLKTPSRIIGYLNADESSLEADGWYRTGDLIEEGPEGSIHIIGRESELINVGGQKVHPAEIETILSQLAEVDACRVYAKDDPITGSAIACEITTASTEDQRIWKRRIRGHCRGQLAPWKIPSSITLTNELSVNARMKRS